jgi:hypothetical protein
VAPVRRANRDECIDGRSKCSCVLGDQTSHGVPDDHDCVVYVIQFVDQADQALR